MRTHIIKSGPISQGVLEEKDYRQPFFQVDIDGTRLRYANTNRVSHKRVTGLMVKEPTTMPWLDHFQKDEVFVDIGANIGMYSVYAAARTGCRVFSFEPEALNYAELNKNIRLNGLDHRVLAYCCAMTNTCKMSILYRSMFAEGCSHHDFDENRWEGRVTTIAPSKESRTPQGCFGFTLDSMVEAEWIPEPDHIKIDVDGLEPQVLRGMEHILRGEKLKTILVETDFRLPDNKVTIPYMEALGWKWCWQQVSLFREGAPGEIEILRAIEKGKGGRNVIYFKDPKYAEEFAAFRESWIEFLKGERLG